MNAPEFGSSQFRGVIHDLYKGDGSKFLEMIPRDEITIGNLQGILQP
jgi:hypothetical protein